MTRLPTPGHDEGQWGNILNSFLLQSHSGDGTLKPNSVGSNQVQAGAIQSSHLAKNVISKANIGLSNVDNTSDLNKPLSTATKAALNAKLTTSDLDDQTATNITNDSSATSTAIAAVIASTESTVASLPAGATLTVRYDETIGWPARPTDRTDITVIWIGGTSFDPPTNYIAGRDLWGRSGA